jgi:hypothetical protein
VAATALCYPPAMSAPPIHSKQELPADATTNVSMADRIAEIIVRHTDIYVVSAHGIALEILDLMEEDKRRANNLPIR